MAKRCHFIFPHTDIVLIFTFLSDIIRVAVQTPQSHLDSYVEVVFNNVIYPFLLASRKL